MPKILIAVCKTDKKVKKAETSIQNLKKIIRTQAEKYDRHSWLVYTFTQPFTLKHVRMLINGTTKKLGREAAEMERLEFDPESQRIRSV